MRRAVSAVLSDLEEENAIVVRTEKERYERGTKEVRKEERKKGRKEAERNRKTQTPCLSREASKGFNFS